MRRSSIAGALEAAERMSGLRGRYEAREVAGQIRVTWTPDFGSSGRILGEALTAAVDALRDAGFRAERAPGLDFVAVAATAADLAAVDEPGVDHEHGRDSSRPMAAE